ncbi:uncharacterized protein LOC124328336 [Daphnia pulicaria]|uniref:uncharacterized protein LOC124328336 n=1 Tax=Daphnia pulicaria TaxID=35523 RepID=UPI001EE9DF53|nr:uncharacterized protein LOC124328336 [Daphnia pulicaria]
MESELDSDQMEDQLDNNGPEWASRECDDDWSTSDNGMISIVPNSTREITFGPSTSDTRMGDNVAGPSGTQPKANNSFSGAASRVTNVMHVNVPRHALSVLAATFQLPSRSRT